MKITISIAKQIVIVFLLLVIGGCCILYGILTIYRELQCAPIEELSVDNCRKGAYVAGTVDSLLTINVDGIVLGESVGFVTMGPTYHCYTIPMADSHYIRIMLPDEETVDALEDLIAGEGEGVYVEGQIVKEMKKRNMQWYESSDQLEDPEEEILGDYVIKQISFRKRRNVLYFGIGILAVMIFAIRKWKIISDDFVVERAQNETE